MTFVDFTYPVSMGLFLFICLFLVLLVLIQKGRGGGLTSAFGGAGANTAFGSKTGDVLTWATSIVFAIFLVLAASLNLLAEKKARGPGTPTVAAPVVAPIPIDAPPIAPSNDQPLVGMPAPTTAPQPATQP